MSRCTTPWRCAWCKRARHAHADAQHQTDRQQLALLGEVAEVVALHQLHHHPGVALDRGAEIEHAQDVGMRQRARSLGLAQEARARLGQIAGAQFGGQQQALDGDALAVAAVERRVHHRHGAAPQFHRQRAGDPAQQHAAQR
jgi:hypothetical protein